jgi:hypothetical protein
MSDKPEVGFQFGVEGDQSLLATVRALREELKNVQKQQQSTASSTRRFLLWRFPFAIIYSEQKSVVTIWAVAHGSRLPEYWAGRL